MRTTILEVVLTKSIDDLLERFGMDQRLCFSDLWCLADTVYESFEKQLWLNRHIAAGGAVDDEEWSALLPENMMARLRKYRCNIQLHQDARNVPYDSEEWAVDLDHNPKRGKTAHEDRSHPSQLFTFISHGTIWHESHQRPLLSMEHLLGHCIMPTKALQDTYQHKAPMDFWDMMMHGVVSPAQVRSMSGNMWHVSVFGMYIMYLLATIELRNPIQRLKRGMKNAEVLTDQDDDEVEWQTPAKRSRTEEVSTGVKSRNWERELIGMPRISFD